MDLNGLVSQIDVGSGEAAYLIVMDNVLEVPTRNQVYLVNSRQHYVQAVVIEKTFGIKSDGNSLF